MRRVLVVLLMAILPLQMSWAEAATYCQHEDIPAVAHFGHHVHKHVVKEPSSKSGKTVSKLSVDNDCATCHMLGAATPPALSPLLSAKAVSRIPTIVVNLLLTSPYPHRPERPKWANASS